jgi:hypothetical protein
MTSDLTRAIVSQVEAIEHLIQRGVATGDLAQIGRALHSAWRTAADAHRLAAEHESLDAYQRAASCDVAIEEIFDDWGGVA